MYTPLRCHFTSPARIHRGPHSRQSYRHHPYLYPHLSSLASSTLLNSSVTIAIMIAMRHTIASLDQARFDNFFRRYMLPNQNKPKYSIKH